MGCHQVSMIFQEFKNSSTLTKYSKTQWSNNTHKSAVFSLQPEDHSRYYPGRYRPQFRPTCELAL